MELCLVHFARCPLLYGKRPISDRSKAVVFTSEGFLWEKATEKTSEENTGWKKLIGKNTEGRKLLSFMAKNSTTSPKQGRTQREIGG